MTCILNVEWGFTAGVDTRFKTKSAYMKFNCESRIRGYMKEVKLILLKNPQVSGRTSNSLAYGLCSQLGEATKSIQKAKVKAEFQKASECLGEMLKAARYNGCYFDRTEKEPDRLCTQEGWFTCQVLQEERTRQSVYRKMWHIYKIWDKNTLASSH